MINTIKRSGSNSHVSQTDSQTSEDPAQTKTKNCWRCCFCCCPGHSQNSSQKPPKLERKVSTVAELPVRPQLPAQSHQPHAASVTERSLSLSSQHLQIPKNGNKELSLANSDTSTQQQHHTSFADPSVTDFDPTTSQNRQHFTSFADPTDPSVAEPEPTSQIRSVNAAPEAQAEPEEAAPPNQVPTPPSPRSTNTAQSKAHREDEEDEVESVAPLTVSVEPPVEAVAPPAVDLRDLRGHIL